MSERHEIGESMPDPPCSICLYGPKKDRCINNWYGCDENEDWPNFVEKKGSK
jgi:hypothetical protein